LINSSGKKLLYRLIPIIETRVLEKNLTDINLISSDSNWIEAYFKTILFLNNFINVTDDTIKRGRTDIKLFAETISITSFIKEDKF